MSFRSTYVLVVGSAKGTSATPAAVFVPSFTNSVTSCTFCTATRTSTSPSPSTSAPCTSTGLGTFRGCPTMVPFEMVCSVVPVLKGVFVASFSCQLTKLSGFETPYDSRRSTLPSPSTSAAWIEWGLLGAEL